MVQQSNSNNPFNTQEWTDFLREEAAKYGATLEDLMHVLSRMNREEFEILQNTFLQKYYKKNG